MNRKTLLKLGFITTVVSHYFMFICFVTCVLFAWQDLVWYIYFTVVAVIARIVISRNICPLTLLENYYRGKLGMTKSTGFLKDWIIRPTKWLVKPLNRGPAR